MGGTSRLYLDTSAVYVDHDLDLTDTATNHLLLPLSNDAVTPTLSFGDGDTGFYEISDDRVGYSVAGALRWVWAEDGFFFGNAGNGAPKMYDSTGTVNNPVFTFSGDENTGLLWGGGDILSLVVLAVL